MEGAPQKFTAFPTARDLNPPALTLGEPLSHGAFGNIREVKIPGMEGEYVLKEIRQEPITYMGEDPLNPGQYVEKELIVKRETEILLTPEFIRECAIARYTDHHPNIIDFTLVGLKDKNLTIAMPRGVSDLGTFMKGKKFTDEEIKRLSFQIIRGMRYYTSKDIIHADIKPQNIIIYNTQFGPGKERAVITDFGSAEVNTCTVERKNMYYTPLWRPPEMFLFTQTLTEKSDVWAFGVMLFQLATGGDLPFENDGDERNYFANILKAYDIAPTSVFHKYKVLQPSSDKPPHVIWKNLQTKLRGYDRNLYDLIRYCLIVEPNRRPTINKVYDYPYFDSVREQILKEQSFDDNVVDLTCIEKLENNVRPLSFPKGVFYSKTRLSELDRSAAISELFAKFLDETIFTAMLHERYMRTKVFGFAVNLFDLILNKYQREIPFFSLAIYLYSCLDLASQILNFEFEMSELAFFVKDEFVRIEAEILFFFDFDVIAPTAVDFIKEYSHRYPGITYELYGQIVKMYLFSLMTIYNAPVEGHALACIYIIFQMEDPSGKMYSHINKDISPYGELVREVTNTFCSDSDRPKFLLPGLYYGVNEKIPCKM